MNASPELRRLCLAALVLGVAIRLVTLWHTSALSLTIVDEQQYAQIARNIVAGNGFAWQPGLLTSIRPPLYPGLLASVWTVTGPSSLQTIRILQIVLALLTCGLIYQLGAKVYDRATGSVAAVILWLYPSFIFFNFLVLTETLFTFLLVAFLLLSVMLVQTPRASTAMACGAVLALAALTRSILWPVPLLLCPALVLLLRTPIPHRVVLAALVFAGYAVVITPWAVRNTRLQETLTIVDTMGGINLRMGNYEHTPDDRMWDAVSLKGDENWVHGFTMERSDLTPTEGRKEKWAQREALAYIRAHPLITFRRALIKFADFWGLEREFIAGAEQGLFSPPKWLEISGGLLIVLAYAAVASLGAIGLWLAPPADWRFHALLVFPIVLFVGAHSLIFGHSRYHLPLIPILGLYAARLLLTRTDSLRVSSRTALACAGACVVILLAVWVRQVAIVDLPRIAGILGHSG